MICVPISRNSRGSSALTLPCVPTGMKTGVSTVPREVVSRPRRACEPASVWSNSNMGRKFSHAPPQMNREKDCVSPDANARPVLCSELCAAQWLVSWLAISLYGRIALLAIEAPFAWFHRQDEVSQVARQAADDPAVKPIEARIALRQFVAFDPDIQRD